MPIKDLKLAELQHMKVRAFIFCVLCCNQVYSKGSVRHSQVEATTCYELVRVIRRHLSRDLPRVKLEKIRSCHTLTSLSYDMLQVSANHNLPLVTRVAASYNVLRVLHDISTI